LKDLKHGKRKIQLIKKQYKYCNTEKKLTDNCQCQG